MKERLKQALSRRQKRRIVDASLMPSAVLLPVYYKQGQYHILFTKRTEKVKEHKGQISFPGGAYQEEDGTLLATALRECAEEIGLRADEVEILGELDDALTLSSNYVISPFVGFISCPHQYQVDGEETEEVIEVPASFLLDKRGQCEVIEVGNGKTVTSCVYRYKGRLIWGATARILDQFLDIFAGLVEVKGRDR